MNSYCFVFKLAVLAIVAGGLGRASAAIVYVDASHGVGGNTSLAPSAGGGVFNPGAVNVQGPANDGVWDLRTGFANLSTIYQNGGTSGSPDNAPRLVTTAPTVPGTYNAYAYFWSNGSSWRMRASLSDAAGDIPLYLRTDAGVTQFYTGADGTVLSSALASDPFAAPVMVSEGDRRLYQIALGQVGANTSISVYIDDEGTTQPGQNERTWYDGIGFELVPEPASLSLLASCAPLAMMARRRRR
jgi:hypothetical protein